MEMQTTEEFNARIRQLEDEWDLAKARVKELEKELEQYKGASHGN